MNTIETEIVNAANEIAPNAPIVEAAVAVATTIADPTPVNILADLELALALVKQFKANIAGLHPSILNIIKALL